MSDVPEVDWSALRHFPAVRSLLSCHWGHGVEIGDGKVLATVDDMQPCHARALQMVVLHTESGSEVLVKLCPHHKDRLDRETTPHED